MTTTTSIEQTVQGYRDLLKQIKHYQEVLNLVAWDLRTGAPSKGRHRRSEAVGTLSAHLFALETSDELQGFIAALSDPSVQDRLDPVTRAAVAESRRQFERKKQIPAELNKELVILRSQTQSVWEEAKRTSNFAVYEPWLEKMVEATIRLAECYGTGGHLYDALLESYDPGTTVAKLDSVFGELRPYLISLNKRIQEKGAPHAAMKPQPYDKRQLEAFSRFVLEQMGYDFEAGRIDETVHPFEIALNLGDVRVTTKYVGNDFRPTVFGTIHEGGHALYEQGIDPALENTPLCQDTDAGLHESQSRFWENTVARGRAFWERYYPDFQRFFPEQTAGVSLDEFYYTINEVKPGFIRIEADEVTYNLHVMLRYELEKELLEKKLKVADLPEAWRAKMKDYLGVVPESLEEGVLQDVHWSGGMFGSFPSYALGNIYAAQIRHAIRAEMPDFDDRIRQGDLLSIKAWLNENIHRHGKTLTAHEKVERISGAPVSSKYLMDYLEEKFSTLYQL